MLLPSFGHILQEPLSHTRLHSIFRITCVLTLSYLALTAPCCDLCLIRKAEDLEADLTVIKLELYGLLGWLSVRDLYGEAIVNITPAKKTKCKDGEGPRRTTHLQSCRDGLMSWRKWQ